MILWKPIGALIVALCVVAPDGYTLLLSTTALAVREAVYRKLPFNILRDFAPVTQVMTQSNVLVVHPGLPVKSVAELIAYARARPGELNYGSSGNGASNHLAGEMFKNLARVNIVHVPYKGLPQAVTDLIGGRTDPFPVSGASGQCPAPAFRTWRVRS